jgi:hypothetical protein
MPDTNGELGRVAFHKKRPFTRAQFRHFVFAHALEGNTMSPAVVPVALILLSKAHPRVMRYRSTEPVLTPLLREERHGIVPHVVFPTGIDRRDDLGQPDRIDVYYGMADNWIGVARLYVPEHLPPGAPADDHGPTTEGHG